MSFFKNLDIYPKTVEDFRVKTFAGGAISLISLAVIALLVFSEFLYYLEVNRMDVLYVDTSEEMKIPINLNITFPAISCDALSIDVMDVSGEHQIGIEHTIFKQRLDLQGNPLDTTVSTETLSPVSKELDQQRAAAAAKTKEPGYCGSCYGAELSAGECCNTCESVKQAYLRKGWAFAAKEDVEQCYLEVVERKLKYSKAEGCAMSGFFHVNKVAGNFHFSPGKSLHNAQSHVHDYLPYEVDHYNTTHMIKRLSFGQEYPGLTNPLDGKQKTVTEGSALFQYFIKVVPTIYEYANGKKVFTNQYSVTEHFRPKNPQHPNVIPGVYFMYDLNPIMVHIKETRKSFLHFITNLCAIIGGVFTVSGLIDTLLYSVSQRMAKKVIVE